MFLSSQSGICISNKHFNVCMWNNLLFSEHFFFLGIMGKYEPKIEVQFPEVVLVAQGATVKLECFALGK